MGDYPDYTRAMQLMGSVIMVPIDIQASNIMAPVDIQAQYVTLEMDIVAQSVGNIAIDIAAQTIGNLSVNIAASAITLNVNLAASDITLDVDITAQSVGNITVNITAQSVGIFLQGDWSALQGTDKDISGHQTALSTTNFETICSYAVPAAKTLFVTDISAGTIDGEASFVLRLREGTSDLAYVAGTNGCFLSFIKPKVIAGGNTVYLQGRTTTASGRDTYGTIGGYEVE